MQYKRLRIYTNIEKNSEEHQPHDEIEQKLSITSYGKVVLTTKLYGQGYPHYQRGRKEEVMITKEVAQDIFDYIQNYFLTQPTYNVVPGFGLWTLSLTSKNNKNTDYYGSTSGVNNELTHYLRNRIPIKDLYILGE